MLAYNYIPLKRVAEKIQVEKTNYLKKIKEEEEKCDKVFSGKEFAAQMELFK